MDKKQEADKKHKEIKKHEIAVLIAVFVIGILVVGGLVVAGPPAKQCMDGIDNDGDTTIDYPNDFGCSSPSDTSELGVAHCDDGTDNDGDGRIDYPDDLGCASQTDNDENNCGDAVCGGGETQTNCPGDCGFKDSCEDTDGGWFVLKRGTVSGYLNNQWYSNTDYCSDSATLVEHYCSGTRAVSQFYNCNQGANSTNSTTQCINGACV